MDADRIAFPLRVRGMEPGDRFRPFGMAGTKKLGDFFTDERVAQGERRRVPIIVGSDDAIVWVTGHRIDAGSAVTDATRRFLWMTT
jgi:tRNA(Ile)-lysidine synthase